MKRIGAVLVVVSMLLACAVPASAAEWHGDSFLDDYYGVAPASEASVVPYASTVPDIPVGGFSCTLNLRKFSALGVVPTSTYVTEDFNWPTESNDDPILVVSSQVAPGLDFWAFSASASTSSSGTVDRTPLTGVSSIYASWYLGLGPDDIWYGTGSSSLSYHPQVYIDYCLAEPPQAEILVSDSPYDVVSISPDDITLTSFCVDGSPSYVRYTPGFRVSVSLPPDTPLYSIRIFRDLAPEIYPFSSGSNAGTPTSNWGVFVPSFNYVAFDSEETKEALERIADLLVEQNEVLSGMYADIMVLLNDLYTRLGSIEAAQKLANSYLSNISSYLSTIRSRVDSIYSLLSTYLKYLQTISTTADNIYSELFGFHRDFLDYMDRLLDDLENGVDGVPEFNDKNDAAQDSMGSYDQIEGEWTQNMTDSWSQLGVGNFQFDGGLVNGFALLTGIFNDLWNIFGVYTLIFIFPLILGIVLTAIGRLSRTGGSKGGDE